jgi:Tol biopolymer transport system component
MDVFVQQLPTGQLKRLTVDPALEEDPSLAPDGNSVAFRSERKGGGIYLSKVDFSKAGGGNEHLLVPGGRNPRFSPNGQSIAYWVGDPDEALPSGEIYVRPLDGDAMRLAADFKDARWPVWSSDGRFILFSGCRTGLQPMPACSNWWVSSLDGKVVKNTGAVDLMLKAQLQPWGPVGGWYADHVVFTARQGTTPSLWELRVSEAELRAVGKPEQLTSGDLREINPSLADDRTLAFEHLVSSLHVSRIDGASHPRTAIASMVTADAALDLCPFVSHNGHWLTFVRGSVAKWSPWVKDLYTGTESVFPFSAKGLYSPIVDDAGDAVVFESHENSVPSIFVATRGRPDRRLCKGCSTPTGWFEDGKTFFYREGFPSSIKMMDVNTGTTRVVVLAKGAALSQASWSPENEYLLFTETRQGGGKQVFAVRLPRSTPSVVGARIPITDASEGSDQARWSGDGKTIFYLSTRDGFACIWGRSFDPRSGKVKGPAFPVAHYHNPGASIGIVDPQSFNLSVAGDTIFFDLGEYTSSIWIGLLKPKGVSLFRK